MADQMSTEQDAQDVRTKTKAITEKAIGELTSKAKGGDVSAYSIYSVDTCYYYTDIVDTEYYCT